MISSSSFSNDDGGNGSRNTKFLGSLLPQDANLVLFCSALARRSDPLCPTVVSVDVARATPSVVTRRQDTHPMPCPNATESQSRACSTEVANDASVQYSGCSLLCCGAPRPRLQDSHVFCGLSSTEGPRTVDGECRQHEGSAIFATARALKARGRFRSPFVARRAVQRLRRPAAPHVCGLARCGADAR